MFWRNKETGQKDKKKKAVKKIEGALWGYMVQQGVIVDILQNLKRVERDAIVGDTPVGLTMLRVFDPATANKKGIAIEEYQDLDDHPELTLYEGYYREVDGQATDIHMEKK